ncbi:MAG TPA: inorganic diphosphatase [Puia sp.]|nr:inorganic diphosphatase [Puia sp.]
MHCIDVIIETPKGSTQKYDFDPEFHLFRMHKIMPVGMAFPYDFGFIPATKAEDGDPMDIVVISEFQSFPGCIYQCRVIGGIAGEQTEANEKGKQKTFRNDRFIAVPVCSSIFEKVETLKDLPTKLVSELGYFFVNYNQLEGKTFKILAHLSPGTVIGMIKENKKKSH